MTNEEEQVVSVDGSVSSVVGNVNVVVEPMGKSQQDEQTNQDVLKHDKHTQQPADAAAHGQDPSLTAVSSGASQCHVQVDQGRACSGHAGLRRDTTKELDTSRDRLPGVRVEAREGHPHTTQGQSQDSISPDDGGAQCREAQEVLVAGTPAEASEGTNHWQRDSGDPDGQGHCGDLRSGRSIRSGSSGIRTACEPHLRGGVSQPQELCELGQAHLQGGAHGQRTPSDSLGTLAREPIGGVPSKVDPGSYFESQGCDEDQGYDRGISHILKFREQAERSDDGDSNAGDDGAVEGSHRNLAGGCPELEGRSSPKRTPIEHGILRDDADRCGAAVSQAFNTEQSSVPSARGLDHLAVPGSCKDAKTLPKGMSRFLRDRSEKLVPETLQSLVLHDRVHLLEIACSQESLLTKTMRDLTGQEKSAQRMSIWNHYDLGTNDGVKAILNKIELENPSHVWLSMECGPYSIMQQINQRTPEQKAKLEEKRREVLKQYVGGSIIFGFCVQKGIHITWEWSQSCQAWRLPLVQKIIQKYEVFFAITRGCQVNLRNQEGSFVSKGWKLMTTNKLMADRMNLPCSCAPNTKHVPCEGQLTKKSAFYTSVFAKRVCEVILMGSTNFQIQKELQGDFTEGDLFGKGLFCICKEHCVHDVMLTCGFCQKTVEKSGLSILASEEEVVAEQPCGLSREEIQKRLHLLHAATGHGPTKYLVQALRRRGVHRDIIKQAEEFTCSVCKERSRPHPRNLASLEPQPPRFDTITADVGHFIHPVSGEHFQFMMIVDEDSRFKVGRVLKGKRQHVSAAQFITTLKESWIGYFGLPKTLRLDPDGAFRSHALSDYCDQHQIFLDLIPSEAHWKLGVCERSVQATKTILGKVCHEFPDVPPEEALAECMRVLNQREMVRGYTPIQHVLGRAPDEVGRVFPKEAIQSPELQGQSDVAYHHQVEALRLSAEKAFLDWNASERPQRAQHSSSRRVLNFTAGDLVYIWRKQVTGKDAAHTKTPSGKFIGPARILATEKHRDAEGCLAPSSSVWLVRGRRKATEMLPRTTTACIRPRKSDGGTLCTRAPRMGISKSSG